MSILLIDDKNHNIVKRNGSIEPYDADKMRRVIMWASDDSEYFTQQLLDAVDIKIYNKIDITKLYDEVINTASNLISDMFPKWEEIAKNLYLLKLHKDIGVKRAEYPEYKFIIKNNIDAGLYNEELINTFNEEKLNIISLAINPEYDKLFTFGGLNLFVQKYCNSSGGNLLELPQHVYMKVAIQLMYKDGVEAIIDKYNQLASHSVTEATPKMVNSLALAPSLFSCCMARPVDSLEGINTSLDMLAKESKYGGGDAWDVSSIRAKGSLIKGNNGRSSGVVPYIQSAQALVGAYNQGSTRSSALVVSYNWFHYESPEITELKAESGKDEDRARKVKYAVKWSKTFSNAIRNDEYIYLFDPHKTQDMTFAYGKQLEKLYAKYSKNTRIHKRKYNARELAFHLAKIKLETGNNYTFFIDNNNLQNIGAGVITSSNLCVSGDTLILTRNGYKEISTLEGLNVECWNGQEWSMTPIFKTSDETTLSKVVLSNGSIINATEYHKWYVAVQDSRGKLLKYVEKRTNELVKGDKLIKFNLETIAHGDKVLEYAYENGFYKDLLDNFSNYNSISEGKLYIDRDDTRLNLEYTCLKDKFFIPDSTYTKESRLLWLAGYFDGDGTLTSNNGTESIQVASIDVEFLNGILLLLQELGVQSKVARANKEGFRSMPTNDGSGEHKDYYCNATSRLLIAGTELQKLLKIGYVASRVMPTIRKYNRSATTFVKVVSVSKNSTKEATYCGTEPKRNKLMFNGVLTGNCMEMSTSYDPIDVISSKLTGKTITTETVGDMSLCNLSSPNIIKWVLLSAKEKEKFMFLLVQSMDNAIDNSFYANVAGKEHSRRHRNLGIGTSNYANWLASNKVRWSDEGARKLTHELYEEISFYAIKASIELAKIRSRCEVFNDTKWAKGLFPHEISLLAKQDSVLNYPLKMDWESLRPDLLKYGIRNSRLLAIAPTATSGKCINATEGVDVPRKLKTIQEGTYSLPFVVPNLNTNREYYQTTFETSNKDVIELGAIRQKFVCMSQSVSLAYKNPNSAYEVINDIMYAEELGLKSIYYTYTPIEGDLEDEECEACGS